jgi:2-deoxy-D-gluconate 3-dehydrogenase
VNSAGETSPFDLEGRVAIVTGGNGGIGLGISRSLVQAGASILISGRDRTKNEAALTVLNGLGGPNHHLVADLRDESAPAALVGAAVDRFGGVDILVNNAGTNIRKSPELYSIDEWRTVLETNLTAAFLCCQAVHPELKRRGGGKIINIGSMMSIFGASHVAAYGASKGGLVQLTKSLAVAWAPDRIQVNAILPGWIDTDLTRRARAEIPGLEERVLQRTPAGRWGMPDDLGGTAVFLAGRGSDFVTGAAIAVDGGYSALG